MMFTRGAMLKTSGGYLARASTIAARYSCIRTQGFVDTKKGLGYKDKERAIIDYQVQRYRILKQIALAYAIKFTGKWMLTSFQALEGGGGSINDIADLDALPFLAATSAGLKALCTFLAWQGIEDLRKCCGGNGYLMSAGIAPLAADYVWQTTAEGDWIILMLQTARFLVKTMKSALKGQNVSGPVDYMIPLVGKDPKDIKLRSIAPPEATKVEDFLDIDYLLRVFKFRALGAVVEIGEVLKWNLGGEGEEDDQTIVSSLNNCGLDLTDAVRIHCMTFMLSNFVDTVKAVEDVESRKVLAQLCGLYALSVITDDPRFIGYVDQASLKLAKAALGDLLEDLRKNVVGLVDAFDIPDRVLNSTIGRSDGNIYEALFESARKSGLNKKEVFDGYNEYLKPHLDPEFLKVGNKVPDKAKL
eukprot:TRINITY_DN5438_c0_g1_i4.p1 TRINITY_DN5438_c0_g1~~TRINITY_DN5438_c0_g1_i4.p1  ORF type:complete len:416 (-),score=97.17 TRINITY_DN5438_c0_g1_i4:40-1287(-)